MKKIISLILLCALVLTLGACTAEKTNTNKLTSNTATPTEQTQNNNAANIPQNSAPALDENLNYYADIDVKDYGKIVIKLNPKAAPATCAHFVRLVNEGFYNGLTFHRIMAGFMMQGGCPSGTGFGSADENVVGEFAINGYDNPIKHTRGAVSMARSDDPNSASSQFFIVHEDATFLDGKYAGFGRVIDGMAVVDAVCTTAQPIDGNGTIPANAQPVISTITIRTETK